MNRHLVVAIAVLVVGGSTGAARSQSLDGNYAATIRCTAFSAELGAFSQQMSLTIAGSSATGERAVGRAGQVGTGGTVERWTGTVAPDGTLAMRTQSPGQAGIDGNFTGKASANGISMKGSQTVSTARAGRLSRECTVTAKRG